MAGPDLTKKALATAFKVLVKEQGVEKVTVMDLCDSCGLNRKTFYYHFKDKFDLAEWIFREECIEGMKQEELTDEWGFVTHICNYFYQEKDFYSKLLRYSGQNSFRQYFRGFMFDALASALASTGAMQIIENSGEPQSEAVKDFYLHFVGDAVLLAIFRWLTDGAKIPRRILWPFCAEHRNYCAPGKQGAGKQQGGRNLPAALLFAGVLGRRPAD